MIGARCSWYIHNSRCFKKALEICDFMFYIILNDLLLFKKAFAETGLLTQAISFLSTTTGLPASLTGPSATTASATRRAWPSSTTASASGTTRPAAPGDRLSARTCPLRTSTSWGTRTPASTSPKRWPPPRRRSRIRSKTRNRKIVTFWSNARTHSTFRGITFFIRLVSSALKRNFLNYLVFSQTILVTW